jgi:PIN domain
MRLRYPGTVDNAIQQLRYLRMYLGNSSSAGGPDGKRDAFLNWCEDQATPQFENLFAPTEEILVELKSSYDRLAFAPEMSTRRLNGLLNSAYSTWDARLGRTIDELQQQKAFAALPGAPVVLDTSALMQAKLFTEFDWHGIDPALATSAIRLIVPIIVVEELDDLLHHRNGDTKQRAREVRRELLNVHKAKPTEPAQLPAYPDVTIEVLLDGDWHQRHPNNDVEIVDQALIVQELTGQPALLATCDGAQFYRAGAASLRGVLLPREDGA